MSDKVVSLKDRAKKDSEPEQTQESADPIAEAMKKNKEKEERLKKEREKANKGVIRSYRLRH